MERRQKFVIGTYLNLILEESHEELSDESEEVKIKSLKFYKIIKRRGSIATPST